MRETYFILQKYNKIDSRVVTTYKLISRENAKTRKITFFISYCEDIAWVGLIVKDSVIICETRREVNRKRNRYHHNDYCNEFKCYAEKFF